jgi:nitrite reductase/ring-hydroxylating ferredoxin subunit
MTSERFIAVPKKSIPENSAKPFKMKVRGRMFQGLVVREKGKYYAYQNLCQHLPIALDLNDGNFYTHDKKYLQCHLHGAMYEITSGRCIAGPCEGATLNVLELSEDETHVIVKIPENFSIG